MTTVLSVRGECSGGPLLPQVEASRDLHGFNRLTVLIHGFNNTRCSARKSYAAFATLPDVTDAKVILALGELCEFYWPGDARALGPASYPMEIDRAKASAELLSAFLRDLARGRSTPLEIQLVCHSLGNRVALELLEDYIRHGSVLTIRYVGALLMAAAVLVSMVENSNQLERAASAISRSRVLFSPADRVLHWAFSLGEFAAGEGFGTAVGRFGEPESGLWADRANMARYEHGDYWVSDTTGTQVKAWLGFAFTRSIENRELPYESLPLAATIDGRALPTRVVGRPEPCGCT
jgi:hypothetical protein